MKQLEATTSTAVSVKNILFATDFSPASEAALPYVVAISRRYDSTIHAVHVVEDGDLVVSADASGPVTFESVYESAHESAQRSALERMQRLALRLNDSPHHSYVRHGRVAEVISGFIPLHHIDLVVVGTHGRTGVEKLMLGSIAEDIVRRASCPILIVGPDVSGHAKLPPSKGKTLEPIEVDLRQIVYATDFTPYSLAAASYAISLAQEFQSRLSLLHVMEKYVDLDRRPGPIETALRRLEGLVPAEAALWCTPEPVLEFGQAADQILQIASDRNADLIILGARPDNGSMGVATHLPWATAHKVIVHANCPVLIVRGTGSVEESST